MNIVRHIQTTIERYQLFRRGDRVVIGVSGGPDSIALLHILLRLQTAYNLQLIVVHCNHQLRRTADADQAFVKKICAQWNIPFHAIRLNIKTKGEPGSWEELAREKRFAALIKVARQTRANAIALGHHLDDCAETILMRLLRGTGLQGLQGILPRKMMQGIPVVRPLIKTAKSDILEFLQVHKIPYRKDETNSETRFFRNKIRLQLLPFLEKKFQPQIKNSLARLAETTALDYDFMASQAQSLLQKLARPSPGKTAQLTFNIPEVIPLHPALRQLLFRLAIASLKGDTNRLTLTHAQKIESFIVSNPSGSVLSLPGRIELQKLKATLIVRRNKSLKSRLKLL